MVCGWRYHRKDSISKRIFSNIASWLRRSLLSENIHDSGCTLRAYRKYCLSELDMHGEMHRYIPALLTWKGYKITEIKVTHHPRMYGYSKYHWGRLIRGFIDLLNILFWRKYSARPLHLFGGLGLFMTLSGIVLGGYLAFIRLIYKVPLAGRTSPLLAILLIILGVQFFISGILADMVMKIYYKQRDNREYVIEEII